MLAVSGVAAAGAGEFLAPIWREHLRLIAEWDLYKSTHPWPWVAEPGEMPDLIDEAYELTRTIASEPAKSLEDVRVKLTMLRSVMEPYGVDAGIPDKGERWYAQQYAYEVARSSLEFPAVVQGLPRWRDPMEQDGDRLISGERIRRIA